MRATFVFAVTSSPAVDFVFSRFLAAVASARDFSYVSGHLATHQRRAPSRAAVSTTHQGQVPRARRVQKPSASASAWPARRHRARGRRQPPRAWLPWHACSPRTRAFRAQRRAQPSHARRRSRKTCLHFPESSLLWDAWRRSRRCAHTAAARAAACRDAALPALRATAQPSAWSLTPLRSSRASFASTVFVCFFV